MMKRILGLLMVLCLCLSLVGVSSAEVNVTSREFTAYSADLNTVANTLLVRTNDKKYQVQDLDGNVLSDSYNDASIRNGFFRVSNSDTVNCYGLLNGFGQQVLPLKYGDIEVISDRWQAGITLTSATAENYDYKSWSGNGYYLIDTVDIYFLGELKGSLTRMQWKYATPYGDYVCIRDREDKYTFYDKNMNARPSQYSSEFDETKGVVTHMGSGQQAFTPGCTLTDEEVVRNVWELKGYLYDLQGNVIGDVNSFYSTSRPEGNMVKVRNKAGLYGLIELSGAEIVPCMYDSIGYDQAGARNVGYIYAVKDGKGGFINLATGEETGFLYSEDIDTDRACYIEVKDLDGSIILISAAAGKLPVQYKETREPYSDENNWNTLAVVEAMDGKVGVINMWGEEVVPLSDSYSGTYSLTVSNDGTVILGSKGGKNYVLYRVESAAGETIVDTIKEEPADDGTWTCANGHSGQTGKFCTECGLPFSWTCENGHEGQTGNFCSECGSPRP